MTMTEFPSETSAAGHRSPGTAVLGILLMGLGVGWLLQRLDIIDLDATLFLPVLLAAIGVALIAGAWDGEHAGLVVFGVVIAIITGLAAVAPSGSFAGGVGERAYAPVAAVDLEAEYHLGLGQLDLDLTALENIGRREVAVRVGAGETRIVVPAGMAVSIDAQVGAGEVILFGQQWSGLDVHERYVSTDYATQPDALRLDVEVAAGKVEVTR